MPSVSYCTCKSNKGFTKVGEDWVCANCKMPSKQYLQNVIMPRILLGERKDEFYTEVKTFQERLRLRREQEIKNMASRYELPLEIVARLFVTMETGNKNA